MLTTSIALLVPSKVEGAAVPDPQDSIIIETKTVSPGTDPHAAFVRVWITNKDTLGNVTLPLRTVSASGGAYMTLAYPRIFNGVITRLTTTLRNNLILALSFAGLPTYDSHSPDSFLVTAFYDGANPLTGEPPNAVRKPLWDIKFDTVLPALGTIEFDSCRFLFNRASFVDVNGNTVGVNFTKGIATVIPKKGDMNLDGFLTPADAIQILNCIFLNLPPIAGVAACDLNCDGQNTAADFLLLLNAVFLGDPFPC